MLEHIVGKNQCAVNSETNITIQNIKDGLQVTLLNAFFFPSGWGLYFLHSLQADNLHV